MPFASIWLGLGLALASIFGSYRLTLKNVCRARHTTRAWRWILKSWRFSKPLMPGYTQLRK